jgi:retron-type reverse transcriptase
MIDDRQNSGGGGRGDIPGRIQLSHSYEDIISIENLLAAWREFVCGKRKRTDVQAFQLRLFDNIYALHRDLAEQTYRHGDYQAFKINDPKPRDIHKATVRDRLLHHAIYRKLYPFFNRTFIADSYSCRKGKGTHKAIDRFRSYAYQTSKNNTRTVWVLKCDIKKFFASVDQCILLDISGQYIPDKHILDLVRLVVQSFHSTSTRTGLPLGNLTSQLLVNVYMNELDHFVKHILKETYYIRYADDFVILSDDRERLKSILPLISDFLWRELRLTLHPNKVSIRTVASGIDFLGWVHFPDHRVLRTTTKRRMHRRIKDADNDPVVLNSYKGLLSYGNTRKLQAMISPH